MYLYVPCIIYVSWAFRATFCGHHIIKWCAQCLTVKHTTSQQGMCNTYQRQMRRVHIAFRWEQHSGDWMNITYIHIHTKNKNTHMWNDTKKTNGTASIERKNVMKKKEREKEDTKKTIMYSHQIYVALIAIIRIRYLYIAFLLACFTGFLLSHSKLSVCALHDEAHISMRWNEGERARENETKTKRSSEWDKRMKRGNWVDMIARTRQRDCEYGKS